MSNKEQDTEITARTLTQQTKYADLNQISILSNLRKTAAQLEKRITTKEHKQHIKKTPTKICPPPISKLRYDDMLDESTVLAANMQQ